MRKFLSILVAAMMLAMSLTACGGEEPDVEPLTSNEETEPVVEETVPETEKETEPPETKPVMVEIFTPVYSETFDTTDHGWKHGGTCGSSETVDGYFVVKSTGGDPNITHSANFDLNCADIQAIRVRFINNTPDDSFQIFFTTDTTTGYCEPASIKDMSWYSDSEVEVADAAGSEEWNEMVIYTEYCDLWEGTLKQMRIDLSNGEGTFIVDSIDFCTVTEELAE